MISAIKNRNIIASTRDNLIPVLYLKGISTNDFPTALSAILGEGAAGLSATNIVRLKSCWEKDYLGWKSRDLSGKTMYISG